MYPEVELTKLDIAHYYESVADRMLPHLRGRPLTLVRCGEGVRTGDLRRDCMYIRHSKVWVPDAARRVRIPERTKIGEYLVVEIHTWNSTFEHVERPDRLVFDIDPGPEVPWAWVVEGAQLVRSLLKTLGLASFVKTTGGRGLHVVVPLVPSLSWDQCLGFSRDVAAAIVRTSPDRYTIRFRKAGRERKLLIDYLRNNRANTSIAAFSTRARPAAPVSMPIEWRDLTPGLRSDRFTVGTLMSHPAWRRHDPWEEYWKTRQRIGARARARLAALGANRAAIPGRRTSS
jgi:bifunctional non-homologous end joining protein LigD